MVDLDGMIEVVGVVVPVLLLLKIEVNALLKDANDDVGDDICLGDVEGRGGELDDVLDDCDFDDGKGRGSSRGESCCRLREDGTGGLVVVVVVVVGVDGDGTSLDDR